MSMNRFYVYAYHVDGVLWYIGKGSGTRSGRHLRRAKRHAAGKPMHRIAQWQIELSAALQSGADIRISVLADNLPEQGALDEEVRLIATMKPCKNKLAGGDGARARSVST
jgi:hypothetical protein